MNNYENKDFYNDYCLNLQDFLLIESFAEQEDSYRNKYYCGKVIPIGMTFRIEIRVMIPLNFPHGRLLFTTRSLSGYPHLIRYRDASGESWFCLNTPFAETAEQQLDEEFNRLREWFRNQLRPELPQYIHSPEAVQALRVLNIYEGENPDELKEIQERSQLTFLGDRFECAGNFKNMELGVFSCVQHGSGQIYVTQEKEGTNFKLPYIVVDHLPKDVHSFASWVKEFNWDESVYKKLFPKLEFRKIINAAFTRKIPSVNEFYLTENEVQTDYIFLQNQYNSFLGPEEHKIQFKKLLDDFIQSETSCRERMLRPLPDVDDVEGSEAYYDDEDYWYDQMQRHDFNLHYFAIGVQDDKSIVWLLVDSNRKSRDLATVTYNLGDTYSFDIKSVENIPINFTKATKICYETYFGRGMFHENLTEKKIAILGLGALGSSIAEALVRGGCKNLSLWDGDLVEPGNICRSSYDLSNAGDSKVCALKKKLVMISPFCQVESHGYWSDIYYSGKGDFIQGDFYGNINYQSQTFFEDELKKNDLIIDCTASNELLHYLGYAAKDNLLLSLCITNHARNLLCISNQDGNPYELRKYFLNGIEQSDDNFYVEGTGCYSPTFLATGNDIEALNSLFVRRLNRILAGNKDFHSVIWNYEEDHVIADSLKSYRLEDSDIILTVSEKTLQSVRTLPLLKNGSIGYLLGGYNAERNQIFVTHFISKMNANHQMDKIALLSHDLIEYIGDLCVACHDQKLTDQIESQVKMKAESNQINTNNPILATFDDKGMVAFYLYIDKTFVPFHELSALSL